MDNKPPELPPMSPEQYFYIDSMTSFAHLATIRRLRQAQQFIGWSDELLLENWSHFLSGQGWWSLGGVVAFAFHVMIVLQLTINLGEIAWEQAQNE